MKTDLLTSIGIAIVGGLIGYFVCNLFVGPIEDVSIKTVDSSISTDLSEPSAEVFNYKAINPTVEVYVGDSDSCKQYDDRGECIDNRINQDTP
ncbi:hypothetical protein IKF30_01570 [Candidatus Saccharibacteria bacterium]|nr:hypothetical protein [Candidatus Saccharibacteria bacterium]